ncbi:MAG: Rab family GTPase [Candidatus Hodarchaeota archaeon]
MSTLLEDVFKVVITGETWVGKTCLVHRYVNARFISDTKKTIGVDFALKSVVAQHPETGEQEITLQLWDFAGEERFKQVLPLYVSGTQGIVFCFEATRPETLENMPTWLDIFHRSGIKPVILLCATKCDLVEEKNINENLVKKMIEKYSVHQYIETSALTGENVEKLFSSITDAMLEASEG